MIVEQKLFNLNIADVSLIETPHGKSKNRLLPKFDINKLWCLVIEMEPWEFHVADAAPFWL